MLKNKRILFLIAIPFSLGVVFALGVMSCHYNWLPYSTLVKTKNSIWSQRKAEYQDQLRLYDSYSLPENSVVMLGDSITFRVDWSQLLNQKIVNRGINGDSVMGLNHRIENLLKSKPKTVFVMIGINDIQNGREISDIFTDYQSLIQSFIQNQIKIVIQSTLLTNYHSLNVPVIKLNELLRNYCLENNLPYLDLNKTMSSNDYLKSDFSTDGIHLSFKGYLAWRAELKNFLE